MTPYLLFLLAAPWTPLFDGHTTHGWVEADGLAFPEKSWRVDDGTLHSLVVDGGFQDIRTERTFREFELEFEWKIAPGGNSGVKYFIEKVDKWKAPKGEGMNVRGRGSEYQLFDGEAKPDQRAGALYGKIAPSKKAERPAGEWNQSRIVVTNGHVEHWLNGELVVRYDHAAMETPIVLQNHHSAAWFRNLRIREPR
jgi:hypothetical protein